MGTIMRATTSPAMKNDALYGGFEAWKIGMKPRWRTIHEVVPTISGCSSWRAQSPKMMLGIAAPRSTMATRAARVLMGAYSVRNSAVPMATGTPKMTPMTAMTTVPYIYPKAPILYGLWIVEKPVVVKYLGPTTRRAGSPR